MRNFLLFGLYFVISVKEVLTESENEIKRGIYPYMAILYYPDENVVEPSSPRFSRSAVLIRPEWLISSSLETNETELGFPRKTLLARVGAISIDANFTLNEDEDEQEREIVQIIRPTNFSSEPWWYNDVTLLKTLLPFNITSSVGTTDLAAKRENLDKICYILVFAKKYQNSSDEKVLMQFPVDLLPSSTDNCGPFFRKETMICAGDNEDNKNSDFCHGNSGGPLLCDGDVIGVQTYIDNNCKQPYLYQSLSTWDDFISCGVQEKFLVPQCQDICEVIDKDVVVKDSITVTESTTAITLSVVDQSNEESSDEERLVIPEAIREDGRREMNTQQTEEPTASISTMTYSTTSETTPIAITEGIEKMTKIIEPEVAWPKERLVENRKKSDDEDSDKMERKTSVEAQQHEAKNKARNGAASLLDGMASLFYSVSFGFLFISCII